MRKSQHCWLLLWLLFWCRWGCCCGCWLLLTSPIHEVNVDGRGTRLLWLILVIGWLRIGHLLLCGRLLPQIYGYLLSCLPLRSLLARTRHPACCTCIILAICRASSCCCNAYLRSTCQVLLSWRLLARTLTGASLLGRNVRLGGRWRKHTRGQIKIQTHLLKYCLHGIFSLGRFSRSRCWLLWISLGIFWGCFGSFSSDGLEHALERVSLGHLRHLETGWHSRILSLRMLLLGGGWCCLLRVVGGVWLGLLSGGRPRDQMDYLTVLGEYVWKLLRIF